MSQRGFTLIEIAIALAITGIMIGGGLLAVGPLMDKARTNQTSATLDQAENALLLFVIRNQRLPCPAVGTTAATSAGYGIEQFSSGNSTTGGACSASPATGVFPWRTLGVDESYSLDGWGNRLSYYAAQSGTASASTAVSLTTAPPVPLTHSAATFNSCPSTTTTYMSVTDASSGQAITNPASTTCDQAAYVLLSHGKSGWYAYSKGGGLHPATLAGNVNKVCNSNPASCSNSFKSGNPVGAYPPTSNSYFDDMVRWRSPALLIQLCGTACGS